MIRPFATLTALVASAGLAACQPPAEPPAEPAPAPATGTEPSSANGFSLVDAMGVQVAYVESRLGPARTVNGPYREYEIGGCTVRLRADGDAVLGYAIPVSEACAAQLTPVLQDYDLPTATPLTFGQFAAARGNARFKADCLTMCGNATDPWVYLESEGPRVSPGIRAASPQVESRAIDAAFRIRDQVREGRGETYLVETRFNCDSHFNAGAIAELDNVIVEEIEVGYDPITSCG